MLIFKPQAQRSLHSFLLLTLLALYRSETNDPFCGVSLLTFSCVIFSLCSHLWTIPFPRFFGNFFIDSLFCFWTGFSSRHRWIWPSYRLTASIHTRPLYCPSHSHYITDHALLVLLAVAIRPLKMRNQRQPRRSNRTAMPRTQTLQRSKSNRKTDIWHKLDGWWKCRSEYSTISLMSSSLHTSITAPVSLFASTISHLFTLWLLLIFLYGN